MRHSSGSSPAKEHESNPLEGPLIATNLSPSHPGYTGHPLHIYPLSTVILLLWMLYIAGMLWLLERSSSYPTIPIQKRGSADEAPWIYTGLPTLVLTLFSQAHGPITAFHLSRLVISSLQIRRSWATPRTWRELTWSADKAWQGPLGLLGASWEAFKHRVGVSPAFALFALTSMAALSTPALLSRAYTMRTIPVELLAQPIITWSLVQYGIHQTAFLHAISQSSTGDSLWITGQSVDSQFDTSIYRPADHPIVDIANCGQEWHSSDFFFAHHRSNVNRDLNARLHGIRYTGNCSVVHAMDELEGNVDNGDQLAALCKLRGYSEPISRKTLPRGPEVNAQARITFDWCGRGGEDPGAPWISDVLRFDRTDEEANWSSALVWYREFGSMVPLERFIECEAKVQFGNATINRSDMTMKNFVPEALTFESAAGRPLVHPVPAAMSTFNSLEWVTRAEELKKDTNADEIPAAESFLYTLHSANDQRFQTSLASAMDEQSMNELFSRCKVEADSEEGFLRLEASNLVKRLLEGSRYMAISLSMLSSLESETFGGQIYVNSTVNVPMTVYTRSTRYLTAVLTTLAVWFLLLMALTFAMLRPTFSSALGSYSTARLFVDRAELLDGHCAGNSGDNPKLSASFPFVGSDTTSHGTQNTGHIYAGGEEPLCRGKRYAGKEKDG